MRKHSKNLRGIVGLSLQFRKMCDHPQVQNEGEYAFRMTGWFSLDCWSHQDGKPQRKEKEGFGLAHSPFFSFKFFT